MGGGGLLGGVTGALFGSPQTVATPDYTSAAQATASGNLDAARAATAANRVNQVTPYGELNYSITGKDPYGNPTWTATQSLNPEQQQLLNYQNASSLGLGKLQTQGLDYVSQMLSKPFDTSQLAQTGINPGETMQNSILRRLQPQIDRQNQMSDAQLANQGIMPGSEAYNQAKQQLAQQQNDLLTSAVIQGTQTGLAANQQGFNQAGYIRNEPINTLNAIRSGSQVTNPNYVSPAQQATTAGADLMSATQAGYNANLSAANAQNAASNSMTSGLFGLGAAGLMSPKGTFSSIFG